MILRDMGIPSLRFVIDLHNIDENLTLVFQTQNTYNDARDLHNLT